MLVNIYVIYIEEFHGDPSARLYCDVSLVMLKEIYFRIALENLHEKSVIYTNVSPVITNTISSETCEHSTSVLDTVNRCELFINEKLFFNRKYRYESKL